MAKTWSQQQAKSFWQKRKFYRVTNDPEEGKKNNSISIELATTTMKKSSMQKQNTLPSEKNKNLKNVHALTIATLFRCMITYLVVFYN